jgi:hypothetical protein
LFAQTYRTELRVEREVQPARLYAANAAWFDAILAAVAPPPRPPPPRGGGGGL